MGFACQNDSYARSLKTKVKSCQPAIRKQLVKGKNAEQKGFEIVLEDTILFPEGGGQPDDRGKINEKPVLSVVRRGSEAVHFTEEEVAVGEEVMLEVDWQRRWDHMQQHSGQHVISALATSLFNFNTTAWNLGEKTSFIELDTKAMNQAQLLELETKCNKLIRDSTPVNIEIYPDQNHPKVKELQSRGFPEDMGLSEVRVVCIAGVDENPCCGTHVTNLAHLQAIKLLGVEKGKKNKVNLIFSVGGRVLKMLGEAYQRDKDFTTVLKGHPDEHLELLKKMQASMKVQQKNNLSLLREIALFEAQQLQAQKHRYHTIHKKEGDQDFINVLISNSPKESLLFVTTGDEKGAGLFALSGPEGAVRELGPKVLEALEAKGALTGGRYQGRVSRMAGRKQAEEAINNYLETSLN